MSDAGHPPAMAISRHAGQIAGRVLDLAFPAACFGCGHEGEPL